MSFGFAFEVRVSDSVTLENGGRRVFDVRERRERTDHLALSFGPATKRTLARFEPIGLFDRGEIIEIRMRDGMQSDRRRCVYIPCRSKVHWKNGI